MHSTNDTRRIFLDFFRAQGHAVMPSGSLVPKEDPTLMFANAGMNQFKNVFTGVEKAVAPRAATSQKCVRAGGKHNDLDNVGYTARHHTFFEMLGNFSFGDYFKEGAIEFAWKLLTQEYKLDKEKLLVTVYHTDDEAFALWKKIAGLPDEKIIRIATNDNFWSMGDTGPCGPCSEIFYDHGAAIPGGPPGSADEDGDRFIEIWNLVFMQFDQKPDGSRINLPKPSIDTGMGLERLSAVLQGVHDNYDIDLFKRLIAASESLTGTKAAGAQKPSHRVIADHLRSSCFLIADGVLPSNEGRGYVLRRIMRRAMRHAHQLGAKEPLMHRLVPALVKEMGEAYPELKRAQASIESNLLQEEERFRETLARGLKLLEEETQGLSQGDVFSGTTAFKLYDTYGFPLDLTQDILRGRGMAVDSASFDTAMAEQKDMARAAWSGSGEKAVGATWFALKEKLGATRSHFYESAARDAAVLALVVESAQQQKISEGAEAYLIADESPFYGESGGQIGDSGTVLRGGVVVAEVLDTVRPLENFILHKIRMTSGTLALGDKVTLSVDNPRRARIRANHSATHLLHAALRRKLGPHVTQKGSLVAADRLRFDYSHGQGLTREQLDEIEAEVNHYIWQNSEARIEEMTPAQAEAKGAMALFGEKYGEKVRVLSMGYEDEELKNWRIEELKEKKSIISSIPQFFNSSSPSTSKPYSIELCGGLHVSRTGDIGLFKILSESAVAAGVRRIEAVTREGAFAYLAGQDMLVRALAASMKVPQEKLGDRVEAANASVKKLEKELAEAKRQLAMGGGADEAKAETIGAVQFIGKIYSELNPKDLRPLAEQLLKPLGENGIVAVASAYEGKASFVVAVAKALSEKTSAVPLVQAAVEAVGGKGGGGRPEMAQGGGPEAGKLEEALEVIRKSIA